MSAPGEVTAVPVPVSAAGVGRSSGAQRRHDLAAGARAMSPWLVGVAPFGVVIGASAARADVPTFAGWLTAPLVYAGSAQVAAIEMLDAGAAPLVVVAAVLAINLRLVLYSAAMAPRWQGTSRWWRSVASYLLIDPSLAVGVAGYERSGTGRRGHRHYLGGALLLWITWLAAVTLGATVGGGLPAVLRLEFVVPLFLVGEVVPRLTRRSTRRAVAAAVVVAVAAAGAPLHAGPLLAMAAGIGAGVRAGEGGR